MEKASKVMYTIANVFTWIIAIFAVVGIVFSILSIANVNIEGADLSQLGVGTLVGTIILLLVSLITILMVRRAKADNSSKAWDVLFLILGIFGGNLFYFLGGLFGLIAVRRQLNKQYKKPFRTMEGFLFGFLITSNYFAQMKQFVNESSSAATLLIKSTAVSPTAAVS